MSSGRPSGMPCCIIALLLSTLAVTATFTMAGVTRAATVSIAWSSESSAAILLSSSGAALEVAAARALVGWRK